MREMGVDRIQSLNLEHSRCSCFELTQLARFAKTRYDVNAHSHEVDVTMRPVAGQSHDRCPTPLLVSSRARFRSLITSDSGARI